MKKNDKLYIPISTEDKIRLIKKANECEMSLGRYCSLILLKTQIKIEIE